MAYRVHLEVDPRPLARGGSVAICAVAVMHVIQAGFLICTPFAGDATPLRAIIWIFGRFGLDLWTVGPLLTLTAIMALFAALFRLGWVRLFLFIPQHFVLGIMAAGGLYAAYRGMYLDGVVINWAHILVDQVPTSVLWIIHSSAILRRAWDPNG